MLCSWLSLLVLLLPTASAQFGMPQRKKEVYGVNKQELRYSQCVVCQELVKQLVRTVADMSEKEMKEAGKRLSEEKVFELLDDVCRPTTEQGNWLRKLDLQFSEEGSAQLVTKDVVGKCRTECTTFAKACEDVVHEASIELGEELWKGTKRAQLEDLACRRWSKSCKKKLIVPEKERKTFGAEQFEEVSQMDLLAEKYGDMMGDIPSGDFDGEVNDRRMMDEMLEEEDGEQGFAVNLMDSIVKHAVSFVAWLSDKASQFKEFMLTLALRSNAEKSNTK
eukprot:g47502.t1